MNYVLESWCDKRPYAVKLHMHVKRQMLDKRCKVIESTDELTKQRRETRAL